MRLKNYNEDLVVETVSIVLKDRKDIKPSKSFVLDVAAYTLNRIPPKYIMSERGFTRQLAQAVLEKDGEGLIDLIELITLVNRAVDVVAGRRHGAAQAGRRRRASALGAPEAQFVYNLPHVFGRLVDARDGTPLLLAEATLFINGKLSTPAEPGWLNPYRTNEQTKGYFSFWPQPETGDEEAARVALEIGFDRNGYRALTLRKILKVEGELFIHDYIRGDKLLDVGTVHLQPV